MSPALRRRRRLGLAAALGVAAVMLGSIGATLAFHVGTVAFELDGNTDPQATAGVDWEDLFAWQDPDGAGPQPFQIVEVGGADPLGAAGADIDRTFVKDFVIGASGPDASYHEPSNKDNQPVNSAGGGSVWGCVSVKNATDKDDILNTYAIAYTGEGQDAGDLIFTFGAERFDDSGTAFLGFWLFQADVACNLTTGKFEGTKTDGDILMLANFSNGGSNVTVNAFSWHPGTPAGTADGTFTPIGTGVRCDLTADNDGDPTPDTGAVDMCAITNGDHDPTDNVNDAQLVTVPWPTEDKDKPGPNDPPNALEPPEFVEGSINLTDAFAAINSTPPACFGSFMTETRSSDTLSATLKDFALGDFNTCDAKVSITPTATNRVNSQHTFTVTAQKTVGGGFVAATTGNVDVTLAGSNGIGAADITIVAAASTCDDNQPTGDNLDGNGQCTLTVNSAKPGTITANATVAVDLGGGSILTRTTNGTGGNSGPAVKTYVNAWLDITGDGTNRVGQNHKFKVTSYVDDGGGAGRVLKGGIDVTVAFQEGNGTDDITTNNTCTTSTTAGADFGTCEVTFTSTKTGTHTGTATATIPAGPAGAKISIPVSTTTDATVTANESVLKTWVNAQIDIDDDSVNRAGTPHTFTVTVQEDNGDGTGFHAAAGETVVPSEDGTGSITGGTCTAGGVTNASGQCTVIVSSATPGSTTVTASSAVGVGGITVNVSTNGNGLNSDGAVKTWVDLRVGITGNDTNGIGEAHTFTVKVEANNGTGWANLSGAQPSVTLTPAAGAVLDLDTTATTCDVVAPSHNGTGTTANGTCVVVFTSDTAGTITGSASVTASVLGLSISASTGDATSLTAATVLKTFKDGTLTWYKVDNKGVALPGATFEVCRTHDLDSSTDPDTYDNIADVCVSVTDGTAPDTTANDGTFVLTGLILGTYTVQETAAPPGYHIDNPAVVAAGSHTLEPNGGDQSLEITEKFVNSKAYQLIVFTCDDIVNTLVVSSVTLGQNPTTDTITAAQLTALGWSKSDGQGGTTPITQADLCALPGANFGGLDEGTYNPAVKIPK